ncbi:MAG: 4Fe-4S dicluster domain-containing protein [Clostridia bacterium]|nr:4Fe-4S dicluster domain-containing protein [Clostridia bacterium]
MKKVVFNDKLCKGCGLCVAACPKKILAISERVNAMGYAVAECVNERECISCAFCATMCPDTVVTVRKEVSETK